MRAILYARVSTVLQENPEAQLEELQRVARARGWEIVLLLVERASGADRTRPQLAEAMKVIREGRAQVLAAVSLDRITRSLEHLLQLVAELQVYRADLVCTRDGNLDTTTPSGRAFIQIRGVFAELERELARERSREYSATRRARGEAIGRPPVMSTPVAIRAAALRSGYGDAGAASPNWAPPSWERIARKLEAEGLGVFEPATISRRVREALRKPPSNSAGEARADGGLPPPGDEPT